MFFYVQNLLPNIILLINKKNQTFLQIYAIILDKVGQNLKNRQINGSNFFLQSGKENALFLERCQNGVKNLALT